MTSSPYARSEHEPGCRCSDCNVVVPFRRPGQDQEPAIPSHIKAELARLKVKWAAERAAEIQERRTLAVQLREFDELHARALERMAQERAAGLHGPGRWLPAWTEGGPLRDRERSST